MYPLLPGKSRSAPPRASAMLESLRGLGYSTATAVADIIDNSISAGAASVALDFVWAGKASHISILDDGCGMDGRQLERAMRLGERSPLDKRAADDLGRFGLGLKTASFSQCRRLTVASIRDGHMNCLRWDLDVLAQSPDDGWHLLEGPSAGSERLFKLLSAAGRGTQVIWEELDRIVTSDTTEQDFLDIIDGVECHLAMVFHRYLGGIQPNLRLSINGRSVAAWDPFLLSHPATWSSPLEKVRYVDGVVKVQCHVLPHKDHLTVEQASSAAGPDGWAAQQGFYVYRNQRMLLAGSWLGLSQGRSWTKEQAHHLARLRLDIPNSADSDWKVNILKSTASPPIPLRARLTWLAEETRARARRVFAHRGQSVAPSSSQPVVQAWRAERAADGSMRYRIDRQHPAVRPVLDEAGDLATSIKAMLGVIEETVPVQRIWLDTTKEQGTRCTDFSGEPATEIRTVLMVLYRKLVLRRGMSPQLARKQLLHTEPFNNYPDLVVALPDNPDHGEQNDV